MDIKLKNNITSVLFLPVIFLTIIWLIKIIEYGFEISFANFGVLPKKANGIKGIFFSPFIHKDFNHLINNSYPILVLMSIINFFYKKIANEIFIWLYFISGFLLWIIGRPYFHIGASGFIYALATFVFVSGLIRNNPQLSAISMIIIFIYGSMIWGVFPLKENISWEGHLCGLISGVLIAIYFKNEGPKRKKYQWEIEEEEEQERIRYYIKKTNSLQLHN